MKVKVIESNEKYYLAELIDSGKHQGWEVGLLITRSHFTTKEKYLTVPPPSIFGMRKYDKCFGKFKYQEAKDYYDSII